MPTLEALSALAGDEEVRTRTVGTAQGPDGRLHPSISVSTVQRRRLPVDAIARGGPGTAMALDARNRVGWVHLTPAHSISPWREMTVSGRSHELGRAHPSGREGTITRASIAREGSGRGHGR